MLVVWAISFPWPITTVPQWHRVHWIPLTDPADKPRDLVANVLLFVPFGYGWRARHGASTRFLPVVLAAAAVSTSAEAAQLFGTERYPSATDVSAAIAGAAIGAWYRRRGEKPDA
jgi:hypothetical protein